MGIDKYLPIFDRLSAKEQEIVLTKSFRRKCPVGEVLHQGSNVCTGLIIVIKGQLRVYISSENGREITINRLLDNDITIFSAPCVFKNFHYDIIISAETPTEIFVIPPDIYKSLMENSIVVSNYTNELISSHLTETMWLVEQTLWKSFDKRLATFLLEEQNLQGSNVIVITHEKIASHLGSAREVVTRMLKDFQSKGYVKLSRGRIEILSEKDLRQKSV